MADMQNLTVIQSLSSVAYIIFKRKKKRKENLYKIVSTVTTYLLEVAYVCQPEDYNNLKKIRLRVNCYVKSRQCCKLLRHCNKLQTGIAAVLFMLFKY